MNKLSKDWTLAENLADLSMELIAPQFPHLSGVAERLIRTLKERCVHCYRIENQRRAVRLVAD